MRIIQPSKINLSLKITGLLPDGRHNLFSVFMPLYEPCDTITLDTYLDKGALEIRCDTPGVPQDMSNLAAKGLVKLTKLAWETCKGIFKRKEQIV
jgi:4-diphosphocytidyl-2C-methyl-D-erythritol kinase